MEALCIGNKVLDYSVEIETRLPNGSGSKKRHNLVVEIEYVGEIPPKIRGPRGEF